MKKSKTMAALLFTLMLVLDGCGSAGTGVSSEAPKGEEEIIETEAAPSDAVPEEEEKQDEEAQADSSASEDTVIFEETDEGIILNAFPSGDLDRVEIYEPSAAEGGTEEVDEEELNRSRDTLLINNAILFYYYETLNKGQKTIYNRLLNVLRYPDSTERGRTFRLKAVPGSKKFRNMFQKAYLALLMDHPELFWFFSGENNVGLQYYYTYEPDEKGRYTYQFQLTDTYSNYRKEVFAFYNEVDSILKELDRNEPKCRLALQVHDRLIDLCSYNYDVLNNNKVNDYGHTAYGALVKDSSGRWNTPVCDGYALAYEFLLQQMGFYVTVIYGDAGSTRSTASAHAWNAVYLNGNWYEVDLTWDDIDADSSWNQWEAGRLAAKDADYMWKLRHYLFLVPTEYISSFTDGASFRYRLRNGTWFQAVGDSVHIRAKKSSSDPSSEAPYCPGGKYFHGQNI